MSAKVYVLLYPVFALLTLSAIHICSACQPARLFLIDLSGIRVRNDQTVRKSVEAEPVEAGWSSTGHFDTSTLLSAGKLADRLNFTFSHSLDYSSQMRTLRDQNILITLSSQDSVRKCIFEIM
ncbi:MAG: hypothetical protein H6696_12200 [Deferribacteres bacterium]|nr:hypothetical protein [candidate division KSB1 bacterium]MCB9502689.1 hypothetical protein [Deferribacteres bacterium]